MPQRQKKGYQDYASPPEVVEPLQAFKPIDLDPCSNEHSIVPARIKIALPGDGLAAAWHEVEHTYVNPPYEDQAPWLLKCAIESIVFDANTITALIPAAVETAAFVEYVFGTAKAIAFWKKRLRFLGPNGAISGNTLPSALCYWGSEPERFYWHFSEYATVIIRDRGWDFWAIRDLQSD